MLLDTPRMLTPILRHLEPGLPFALPLLLAILLFPPGSHGIVPPPEVTKTPETSPSTSTALDGFHLASTFRIVVETSSRTLMLFRGNSLMALFPIALGRNPHRTRELAGDGRTPHGRFYVCRIDPRSEHRWSFLLSYPNAPAARRGFEKGQIDQKTYQKILRTLERHETPPQATALGGGIQIHGGGRHHDWTQGCMALENSHIEQLARFIRIGTPVLIR